MGKRLWFLCTLGVVLAALAASPLLAQTQFASVTGRVTDPSGAAVPGARVTVTNMATGVTVATETGPAGSFTVANLSAGRYTATIELTGFRREERRFSLSVGQALTLNISLQVGAVEQVVVVEETPLAINLVSGTLSKEVTAQQVADLPLLTRNPYGLITTVPGAADVGAMTGDTRGGQGATGEGFGIAINGGRTSQINYMLDGGENNDTFVAGVAELVPLEAVQEFKVDTSAFSAAYGRNPVNVNVITKSGTNNYHGTLWEYYRGAALSAATFEDNATGTPKSNFVRNDFGAAIGGPIRKDKTFVFGSFEGLRVRSRGRVNFFTPTSAFTDVASANTNGFLNAFGGIPNTNCSAASETARDIFERIEGNGAGSYGSVVDGNVQGLYASGFSANPTGAGLVPAATNLFCRSTTVVPEDTGAGLPQDTWRWTARIDQHFTDRTTLTGRYAFENAKLPDGSVSFSPYGQGLFDTGQRARNQNLNLTLTHTFTPQFYSESRFIYNRVFLLQPEGGPGKAPETTPCWSYDLNNLTTTGELLVFPGYVPAVCAFAGIPFGGPQNIYQAYQGFTYSRGNHTFRMGGQYLHMRDNRTFGAYQNAFFDTFTMQGMIDGTVDLLFAAYDPKGHVPDFGPQGFYSLTTDGPLSFPSFTRHYHYNEFAFFVEDSWRVSPRLTITPGIRWEYFGVLHSPGAEKYLDANLYLNAVGAVPPVIPSKNIFEQVRDARFRRSQSLYRPDYKNFAPRIGFAWDITGKGQTVLRAGYGIFWDRNFGNAVFNVIQNPPNYGVIATTASDFGVTTTIAPNQFDTLRQLAGGTSECPTGVAAPCFPISSSARMLDNDLRTAYSSQWNVSFDHEWFGKGIVTSLAYVGANGIHLYSLNNLNTRGSCLRDPQAVTSVGLPCDPATTPARLNQSGLTGMNRRGNEGLSRYNALQVSLRTRQIRNTGLTLDTNYSFGHSIDNESSFFSDSLFEGFFGFGFRDPYNPGLDRASSANDIRHRYTLNAVWQVPWGHNLTGIGGQVLGGWTVTSIFTAQTGGAFSVYDASNSSSCNSDGTNFCLPVLAQPGVPSKTDIPSATQPNTYTLYTVNNFQTQQNFCSSPNVTGETGTACTAALNNLFPTLLSPRNLFRLPGLWGWDASVLKDFPLPREGMRLQFRAEFFDALNHSNLYAVPGTNQFSGPGSQIVAKRGCVAAAPACSGTKERRNIQLALKFFF